MQAFREFDQTFFEISSNFDDLKRKPQKWSTKID